MGNEGKNYKIFKSTDLNLPLKLKISDWYWSIKRKVWNFELEPFKKLNFSVSVFNVEFLFLVPCQKRKSECALNFRSRPERSLKTFRNSFRSLFCSWKQNSKNGFSFHFRISFQVPDVNLDSKNSEVSLKNLKQNQFLDDWRSGIRPTEYSLIDAEWFN